MKVTIKTEDKNLQKMLWTLLTSIPEIDFEWDKEEDQEGGRKCQ